MARFQVERAVRSSAVDAWERVTDWSAHTGRVPLTRIVAVSDPATGVGARFTARTGLGRLGFDDPMEVIEWSPPVPGRPVGRCRLVKRGRVVRGWAEIEVHAPDRDHARDGERAPVRVVWREEIGVRGVPRAAGPLLSRGARIVFARVLDGLLRER